MTQPTTPNSPSGGPATPLRTIAGGRSRSRPWLRTVDFAQPSLLAPDQEARLRQVGTDFCALLGARATRELTTSMEVVPLWSRAEPWKVAHHLPAEEAVALTLASEDGGSIFLSLDPTLVALLVERTLGGELDPAVPPRTITSVDRALVTGFVELVAASYGELWHDATGATAPLLEVAAQRDLALACDPAARTTVVAFEVRIGAPTRCSTSCCPMPRCARSQRGSPNPPRVGRATTPRSRRSCATRWCRPTLSSTCTLGRRASQPTRSPPCGWCPRTAAHAGRC